MEQSLTGQPKTERMNTIETEPGKGETPLSFNRQPAFDAAVLGDEDTQLTVSLVIPLYNERANIEALFTELVRAIDPVPAVQEVILVDDGSTDGGHELLEKLPGRDPRFHIIRLRRNFGQTAAFSAGFDYSQGDVIITMDGDLQNDPADIPKLLAELSQGYDIVSGWRVERQDKFFSRRLPSILANRLISRSTGVTLHDYGCSLKAYRREVLDNTRLYGELHRFIPALASVMGVTISEVAVNHRPRLRGRSKYGLGRTLRVLLDLLTVKFLLTYGTRPMQLFGLIGLTSLGLGGFLAFYLTILRMFFDQPLADRPLLLLAILLMVIGVQLLVMGLIGELIVRTYYEIQNKPIYAIREIVRRPPED